VETVEKPKKLAIKIPENPAANETEKRLGFLRKTKNIITAKYR